MSTETTLTPQQVDDAIDALVQTKYQHEVAKVLDGLPGAYLVVVVSAALARTAANGRAEGARQQKALTRERLGL